MSDQPGSFIWYELLTTDPDAAAAFYGTVVGWTAQDSGQPGMDYRFFLAGEAGVGGFMALTPDMLAHGARPGWFGYLAVEDVDRAVEEAVAAGSQVQMPAMTLDGVGRMAMIADPQGASLYVMRGFSDQASTSFAPERTGHVAWNELQAADPDAALSFYGRFGLTHGGSMDMGEAGAYHFLHLGARAVGGVARCEEGVPPGWTFYIAVPDIDAAQEAIARAGGRLLVGPHQIPGGDWIVIAHDPQGARFGLVGPRG
jgi:uncharacterized protein